jgi:hypothetical protein
MFIDSFTCDTVCPTTNTVVYGNTDITFVLILVIPPYMKMRGDVKMICVDPATNIEFCNVYASTVNHGDNVEVSVKPLEPLKQNFYSSTSKLDLGIITNTSWFLSLFEYCCLFVN